MKTVELMGTPRAHVIRASAIPHTHRPDIFLQSKPRFQKSVDSCKVGESIYDR